MCVQTSHCCNHHQTQSYNATSQSPLYLDIYVSTQSSSRQASDKERCGQAAASCPVASVPITMQTIAHHTTTAPLPPSPLWSDTSFYLPDSHCGDHVTAISHISTYLHIYISTISAHPHARSQPRVVAQIRILDTWLWKVNNNVHFLFLSSRNLIFHIHVEVLCETQVSRARQNTLGLYFTHFADNIVLTFKIEHSTCKPAQPTILTLPSCTRTTALLSIKIHL